MCREQIPMQLPRSTLHERPAGNVDLSCYLAITKGENSLEHSFLKRRNRSLAALGPFSVKAISFFQPQETFPFYSFYLI